MPDDNPPNAEPSIENVEAIHDHLAATAELPVDATASTYLGESEAVARDALDAARAGEHGVVRMRLGQLEELLSHVDETGNPAADEHVAEARRRTREAKEPETDS